ncbi:hypothetical protein [Rhodovulum sp. PH10]|uniref:hypothetical protein n=1 Tax=Rhodovulum sp. PH10 TaxID=1187851 RepID=UPI0012FA7C8E|nr:hypothetical protein [Rhodovulum sp. PH10]
MPENLNDGNELGRILSGEPAPDQKDEKIAALETKLKDIENIFYEERFLWIIISIILFDAYIFTHMANWAGAVVVGIFELIFVLIMADRCGVDTVAPLIDKITGFLVRTSRDASS